MWYNTQMKARSPRYQSPPQGNNYQRFIGQTIINSKERLLNTQKRHKLRDLLIDKFTEKYKLGNNRHLIEDEITKFLKQEKLNEVDLQRLEKRLKRIIAENNSKINLESNLAKILNYNLKQENKEEIFQKEETMYKTNYQPRLEPNINDSQNNSPLRSTSYPKDDNFRPLTSQTYIYNGKLNLYKKRNKDPEEELAALEAEAAAFKEKELREKGYYNELNNDLKKIDFKKYGNEWAAMAAYDKKIFDQQKIDESIRKTQLIKRTKFDLDEQVKEKIKREYEDDLREKEYDKLFKEHQKELDEIEKEREKLLREQYLREKASREAQLKDNYIRKRIDELKEKKFDKKIIRNVKTQLENEKMEMAEQKRKRNAEYNKFLKENEENKKNLKILLDKERKEDLQFLDEQRKMDIRADQEREYLLNKIRSNCDRYTTNKKAEEKLIQIKKEQEEEEKKMLFLMNETIRIGDEKEFKEKLRRAQEKKELKKFYDMQVEEKKKDSELEKILDGEQARIWNRDCQIYREDEKRIAKILRDKNIRNLEVVKEMIRKRKEKENNKNNMNDIELAMNRDKLLKAQEALP